MSDEPRTVYVPTHFLTRSEANRINASEELLAACVEVRLWLLQWRAWDDIDEPVMALRVE